jgi:hypothetical protein
MPPEPRRMNYRVNTRPRRSSSGQKRLHDKLKLIASTVRKEKFLKKRTDASKLLKQNRKD